MERPLTPNFDRFLRRLHWRQVGVRVLERMGVGVAMGCAAALVGLWAWRRDDALAARCVITIAAGAMAGLGWGWFRRPRPIHAAVEADRQLQLHDLLATACAMRAAPHHSAAGDPWVMAVLAMAEERCLAPISGAVKVSRLGTRAWAGVGLAVAVVATITLAAPAFREPTPDATIAARPGAALPATPLRPIIFTAANSPRVAPPEQDNDAASPGGQNRFTAPAEDPPASPAFTAAGSDESAAAPASAAPGDAGGSSGSARTTTPPPPDPSPRSPAPAATPPDHPPAVSASAQAAAKTSGGGGIAPVGKPPAAPPGPAASSSAAGGDPTRPSIPPWRSDRWPARAHDASAALDAGRIHPAYRDVVRAYFDHTPAPPAASP